MNLTIIVILSLVLLWPLVSSTYGGQSSDLGSALEKAQKSLATSRSKDNPNATNIPNASAPKNVDLHVNVKLNYDLLSNLWLFPSDASINFTEANKICPEDCIQQLEDVSFNTSPPASPDEFYIYGVDKIRDTKSPSSDVIAWKYYKMVGWNMIKTGIEENTKNGETTYSFDGILTLGVLDPVNNPEVSYKITGSFQEPSGNLMFTGRETTVDDFFAERFGYK